MIEADAPSTEVLQVQFLAWCARPTGGGHGLTIDDATQRFKGAKRRPRCRRISQYNAANKAGATESPGPQMARGRIEHTLLDEGRASSPTDLRPSPATTLYHKKYQMFLSKIKGRSPVA
jgi:hypothetical protein